MLIVAGLLLGYSYLMGDDSMERTVNRIAQLYGYSVCLFAVIMFVFNLQSLAENVIDASHPLDSPYGFGTPSLTSFEAYKATYRNAPGGGFVTQDGGRQPSQPAMSDSDLRAQYEALRADRLASSRLQSQRQIFVDVLLIAVSIGLFFTHWRWLRSLSRV